MRRLFTNIERRKAMRTKRQCHDEPNVRVLNIRYRKVMRTEGSFEISWPMPAVFKYRMPQGDENSKCGEWKIFAFSFIL